MKYTREDFEQARFAEHPDGRLATRDSESPACPWRTWVQGYVSDARMAEPGWVPVPTESTITESQFSELSEDLKNRTTILACALERVGIKIIPDPEPTNTEKLVKLLNTHWWNEADSLAEYLNNNGVTVKDN